MERKNWLWQLMGFATASLLGVLLHFLYYITGGSVFAAPFSGVNESTWEHMKLLFWPMLLFALVQGRFYTDRHDFWCVKLRGILLGLALIPVIFYTYNGAVGKSPDWLNIAIFFVSAALSYIYELHLLNKKPPAVCHKRAAITALILLAAAFVIFTFLPPPLGIFTDPITGTAGVDNN